MFERAQLERQIRGTLWPDGFAEMGHIAVDDGSLLIRGTIALRGGEEANRIVN